MGAQSTPPADSTRAVATAAVQRRRAQSVQMLGFFAVMALLPIFVRNGYYVHIGVVIGINLITVIGLNLLIGYAGQVSLGHAAFYGIGAYTSGILTATYGWSPWFAVIVALALTCAVAWLVGKPTLRLKGHYLAMGTLGFGIIVAVLIRQMSWLTCGSSGLTEIPGISIAGQMLDSETQYFYFVWFFVVVVMVLFANLVDSRPGRALRALHDSEAASDMLGVDTASYKVHAFVISAAHASLAGTLYAHSSMRFLSPTPFGFHTSIALLVMVVLGGSGTLWGPALGAISITVIQEVLRPYADFDIIVYGLMLMVLMILMPGGIARGLQNLAQWWQGMRERARERGRERRPREASP